MHRHGYKGRKFNRKIGPRKAMIKTLADDLIMYERISTTVPKAKEILPYVEKLITKAKKGDLHNWRLVRSKLTTDEATHKLFEEIAPALKNRQSGHLRIIKHDERKGDNAKMADIEFVDSDEIKQANKTQQGTKVSNEQ